MRNIAAEPLIEMQGATVSFDGLAVLEDASLSIMPSDYIGIVGPSGSGKTTMLKALAGSVRISAGRLQRRRDTRIGYVPQVETINWYFPVTVWDVLVMAIGGRNLPWAATSERDRAMTILESLGIADLRNRQIRALSGGQQQRVFIARALMNRPSVLMLDEPTSGVDVSTRHDILHLLHDLNHDSELAIVLTTHDLNGIAAHMHTLICLNRRVIAAGRPQAILSPEVLEATYGAPMEVLSHGGMPVIVEHFEDFEEDAPASHHEH